MKLPSREKASEYGHRAQHRRAELGSVCIEGEYVTYREIASRLDVNYDTARKRMRALRKLPGAITWERLRGGEAK